MAIPKAPPGAGAAGRGLWRAVSGAFELAAHERLILVQACHTADICAELQAVVARDGAVLVTAEGPRAHPACRELRQQRITLARLVAALRIPADEEEDRGHGQYRGTRGVYAIGGGAA